MTDPANDITNTVSTRLDSIDFIRGVVLLGILVMNIVGFAMPQSAYFTPRHVAGYDWGNLDGANGVIQQTMHFLAEGKFISIFAMLFGVGVFIQRDRAIAAGHGLWQQNARMIVLMLIGLLHAHLLWYGDILFSYAVVACVAVLCVRLRPLSQLAIGVVSITIPLLIFIGLGALTYSVETPGMLDDTRAEMVPTDSLIAGEIAAYRGPYLGQFADRSTASVYMQTVGLVMFTGPLTFGLMLVGMSLYRWGWFTTPLNLKTASTSMLLLICGFAIQAAGTFGNFRTGDDVFYLMLIWFPTFTMGMWLVAIGYAKALATCALCFPSSVTRWFTDVGRMSLSNYLLQTILCTSLFYGHGLGWFATMDRVALVPVVLGVWAVNLIFSRLWLSAFPIGPAEWVYRRGAKLIGG